jgi:hypothetical protein
MNHSLQYRFNNHTLPVVKNGKLAGLVMRHNSSGQTTDVIPAPVVEHFLAGAENGDYRGFPRSGIFVGNTEDPQLRKYAGIADMTGGVYVEAVVKDGAATKAGLLQGDIIMNIAGYDIDNKGNYQHPLYGKVAMPHLVRCEFHAGDTVPHTVFRNGKLMEISIVPERQMPDKRLVPPYRIDAPPRYYILGGLIIQELTIGHLMEYGSDWTMKAPVHLVYYAANQDFIDTEGREKIVFLSSILPTAHTIGYEELSNLIITTINGKFITKIEDVPEALKAPVDGFHKLEFEQHPRLIYLDAAQIPEIDQQIMQRYRLTQLENLNHD